MKLFDSAIRKLMKIPIIRVFALVFILCLTIIVTIIQTFLFTICGEPTENGEPENDSSKTNR